MSSVLVFIQNTHAFLREEAPFLLGLITSLAANYIFGFIFLVVSKLHGNSSSNWLMIW